MTILLRDSIEEEEEEEKIDLNRHSNLCMTNELINEQNTRQILRKMPTCTA